MQASEAMVREVTSIGPEATVAAAARLMVESGHGTLPVVDGEGKFLGVLSKHDLVRQCLPGYLEEVGDLYRSGEFQPFLDRAREVSRQAVSSLMTGKAPSVQEDTPLAEIASLMVIHHAHLIPVLREGKLLGVIGMQDIVAKLVALAFAGGEAQP